MSRPVRALARAALGALLVAAAAAGAAERPEAGRRAPRVLARVAPEFPPDAGRVSGYVVLALRVGAAGAVEAVELATPFHATSRIEGALAAAFDSAAARAVARWRFAPATAGGTARAEWVNTTLHFAPPAPPFPPPREGRGHVVGRVWDAETGGAVLDPVVVALASRDTVRPGPDGAFGFAELRAGAQVLRVAAVGHAPARVRVDVRAGATDTLDVPLARVGAPDVRPPR